MKLKGKAWVFGDDINTDVIIPFRFKSRTNDPHELAKYAMYGVDPEFYSKISKGDIIVGGKNFGGGSSREQAPIAIKYSGISLVIAESFSRIFTRNCFAIGLPILEVEVGHNLHKEIKTGHKIEVDMNDLTIKNLTTKKTYQAKKWPKFLTDILMAGGLLKYYKKNKKFPW